MSQTEVSDDAISIDHGEEVSQLRFISFYSLKRRVSQDHVVHNIPANKDCKADLASVELIVSSFYPCSRYWLNLIRSAVRGLRKW